MRKPLRPLACAALALAATAAHAFDLTVTLEGARSHEGFVAAALYGAPAGWLDDAHALQAERVRAADRVVLVFKGLPAGRYAVSAVHDENANGRLDRNVLGMPTEPYGFSRDARAPMAPPSFADAALELGADTAITIHLQ